MNKDDIIRMAMEAGFAFDGVNTRIPLWISRPEELERFAYLVAAAERKRIESRPWGAGEEWIARAVAGEREACAKLCDAAIVATEQAKEQLTLDEIIGKAVASGAIHQSKKLSAAIRARGNNGT